MDLHRRPLSRKQSDSSPYHKGYGSFAEMVADQSNQFEGYIYFDGNSDYIYLGTTNGDETDYRNLGSGTGTIWRELTGNIVAQKSHGYIVTAMTEVEITLPISTDRFTVEIAGNSIAGWKLIAPVGKLIRLDDTINASFLQSTSPETSVKVLCLGSSGDGDYVLLSSMGQLYYE